MGDSMMMQPGETTSDATDTDRTGADYEGYVRAILTAAHAVQERRVKQGLTETSDTLSDLVSEDLILAVALHLPKELNAHQAFALRHPEARRIDQMNADALLDAVSSSARQAADETRKAGRVPVYKPLAS